MKNLFLLFLFFAAPLFAQQKNYFRPPSVPLITHDPYFSVWSSADRLTDRETTHWTGANQPMHCIVQIDGTAFRVMGAAPSYLTPLKQTNLTVNPTRTIYQFENDKIKLALTFINPLLPGNLDVLSRPVTYICWDVNSKDGKLHDVKLYFDIGAEIAVDNTDQKVKWDYTSIGNLKAMKVGSGEQKILGKSGDNVRIDWGYAYLAAAEDQQPLMSVNKRNILHKMFAKEGKLAGPEKYSEPRELKDGNYSLGVMFDLGEVGQEKVDRWVMVAYDDIKSIRYFGSDLIPWWRHNYKTMEQLLLQSSFEYNKIKRECEKFDNELTHDLKFAGGEKYSKMCALAYRQCFAAHKLTADDNGMPLIFPKENFSNGCISTVDVIYPASPFFLLFSPALTKAMLEPVLDYAASSRWKFPFAPHDLGTYPYATGQVYGGGEKSEEDQMPVEETGNMIIMVTALAKVEGSADFAKAHWNILEKWADYLLAKGFDPENQLCTDDFAGHLAHNINLSAKTIIAIAGYSVLCDMLGMKEKSLVLRITAEDMVKDWVKQSDDGDHTRLAFDRPATWSQKYNLVWDKILNLNLFPGAIVEREISYYKKMQAEFGLPLDSRERYTKNDWITWTASLADNQNDFKTLFNPVYGFAENTPQRVPLSDWYITDNAYQCAFQARSVVGGFFIKVLRDKNIWKKWAGKGTDVSGHWAPLKLN